MRKSWLSWRFSLMSLVLLLAQQGAVLHELSHLLPALRGSAGAQALVQPSASGSSQAPRSEGRDRADAVCQLCLGFAQMGDLAAWRFVPPDLLALQQTPPRSAPFLWREGTRPPHSARDPPARFTPLLS